jgi:DNA-binding GntR family transcriptional regulator
LNGNIERPAQLMRGRTLTDQAAEAIRARIVDGELQLGEALSEIALAGELGVSKTPVREALLRLRLEGLVDILPQRGTFAFQLNGRQVAELSEFREVLEVTALRHAMQRDPQRAVCGLDAAIGAMAAVLDEDDARAYRRLDDEFHQIIVRHAANEYLSEAYGGIAFRVQALRNRLSLDSDLNVRSLAEHRGIVAAMRDGDSETACRLLRAHIGGTKSHYLAILSDGPGAGAGR